MKIDDLAEFVLSLEVVEREQVLPFCDDAEIKVSFRQTACNDDTRLVAYKGDFECALNIERFPICDYPAKKLYAQVSAWLCKNDYVVEFQTNETVLNKEKSLADIEITLTFEDEIYIVEDAVNGDIEVNGKLYSIEL